MDYDLHDILTNPKYENINPESDLPPCKGLVFRGERNSYSQNCEYLREKISLRLLKKKSCKGCAACGFWWEIFSEDITDYGIPSKNGIEDGKLYRPVGHTYSSYEGDYDFEWQFEEYKEDK
jgi:hypothetical protein